MAGFHCILGGKFPLVTVSGVSRVIAPGRFICTRHLQANLF